MDDVFDYIYYFRSSDLLLDKVILKMGDSMLDEPIMFKELAFVYIVRGEKFLSKSKAERKLECLIKKQKKEKDRKG